MLQTILGLVLSSAAAPPAAVVPAADDLDETDQTSRANDEAKHVRSSCVEEA